MCSRSWIDTELNASSHHMHQWQCDCFFIHEVSISQRHGVGDGQLWSAVSPCTLGQQCRASTTKLLLSIDSSIIKYTYIITRCTCIHLQLIQLELFRGYWEPSSRNSVMLHDYGQSEESKCSVVLDFLEGIKPSNLWVYAWILLHRQACCDLEQIWWYTSLNCVHACIWTVLRLCDNKNASSLCRLRLIRCYILICCANVE